MSVWAIADLHLSFARPDRRERYAGALARPRREDRARVARGRPARRPGAAARRPVDGPQPPRPPARPRLARPPARHQGPRPRATTTPGGTASTQIRPMLRESLLAVGGDAVATHGVDRLRDARRARPRRRRDSPSPGRRGPRARRARPGPRRRPRRLRDGRRAALRPLALPPLRPAPPPRPLRRPVRAGRASPPASTATSTSRANGRWPSRATSAGVRYHCVAADAIGFRPLRIATVADGAGKVR